MSTVTYRHEQKHSYKKKGIRHTISESLVDGEFLTLYFSKAVGENDPNFYKLSVKETSKDKFNVKETKGKTETEKEMTKAEFLKLLKKDKDLSFAVKYIEKERGTYKSIKGGAGHKKESKKASKKSYKCHHKGGSIEELMGGAKKKKASKKASKKSSKKKASKKSKKSSKKKGSKKH